MKLKITPDPATMIAPWRSVSSSSPANVFAIDANTDERDTAEDYARRRARTLSRVRPSVSPRCARWSYEPTPVLIDRESLFHQAHSNGVCKTDNGILPPVPTV